MIETTSPERGHPPGLADRAAIRRRRLNAGLAILVLALALATALSIAVGARSIPAEEVLRALVAPDGGESSTIVRELRIPRTLLGLVVGLALGAAGLLMQSHTRNPIAEPSLLGVTYGAACAIVLSIFLFGVSGFTEQVWFALAGALLAGVGVFALASGGGRTPSPVTLILSGAAMTALLSGVTSAVVLLDHQSLEVFRFWRIGSLSGRPAEVTLQVLPFLATGLVLALANAPGLNALALGEEVATALGQRVWLTHAVGVLAIALLTGASVAAAGPIGFLGLMAPHLARWITGPDHRWALPYAALSGAVLLLLADVAGRILPASGEIEVGIVLAVLGGPFLIALVRRQRLHTP
ncbi:iron chelate uptake ABC transporter family permease subunit [Lipingzhangella sp. LS1_29]|uniref:Iron chelate uptake ABC transporter family permease subunit n=1 Tax=Lipingzhangella rawalii TaxID=2055835 RepID=A0ABU2H7E8_9ACTN|nr:iron chelate uptake ABC transporter family permease subunit [Lipingzhangella rawalii]MDS1271237.1 iron chelate uptake ABC transporter family permease subunit [Lipingzhangella rawalii]